jgi:hypothetical protein
MRGLTKYILSRGGVSFMKADREKRVAPDEKEGNKERPGPAAAEHDNEENCRCKEISKKSLPDLLKVVIGDLSFWKKGR